MDQAVVECAKAVGIDRQPLGNTGAKALNRDVRRSRQIVHELPSLL